MAASELIVWAIALTMIALMLLLVTWAAVGLWVWVIKQLQRLGDD